MARRGWAGSITTALGVAAGAGAAQLGFGYGLGIINWAPPPDGSAASAAWTASLIWATWIAATSTVLGAVCAQRLRHRGTAAEPDAGMPGRAPAPVGVRDSAGDSVPDAAGGSATAGSGGTPSTAPVAEGVPTGSAAGGAPAASADAGTGTSAPASDDDGTARAAGGTLGWIALAAAAGIGALVTVLLVAVPARVAVVPDVSAPRDMAAVYAALGVLVGVGIAVWALHSRAAATNVIATVGWLWLLAVVAVVDGVLAGRGLTSAQLGIWQLSAGGDELWIRDWFYWPGALLSLGSALVIGILAARRAARYADRRVGATSSGAAGPLLVAVAYLLAVPGLAAIDPEQVSAHLIAPYAVIVGLGGSALVATLGQRADRRAALAVGGRAGGRATAQPAGEPAEVVTDLRPGGSAVETSAAVGSTGRARARTTGNAEPTGSGDAGASATGSGSGDVSGRSAPTSDGGARRGRGAAARTSSTDEEPTGRVPNQRTGEGEPAGAPAGPTATPEVDGGGSARRPRSPRRTR